jgi:hypothetical protein
LHFVLIYLFIHPFILNLLTEIIVTHLFHIHPTMPASGSGAAARGMGAIGQFSQSMSQRMSSPKPSLRGHASIRNLLQTTASLWACEYEDCRFPGGASA